MIRCPGCWRAAVWSDPQQQRYVHEIAPCFVGCHLERAPQIPIRTRPAWTYKTPPTVGEEE